MKKIELVVFITAIASSILCVFSLANINFTTTKHAILQCIPSEQALIFFIISLTILLLTLIFVGALSIKEISNQQKVLKNKIKQITWPKIFVTTEMLQTLESVELLVPVKKYLKQESSENKTTLDLNEILFSVLWRDKTEKQRNS